ncbi:phenylpyruvate tautomerase MIF-related protein [Ectothiorhodospira mobilis]|uniref:phenylpyruvate tautomerase MIF-related protein n=1 Tax=Ectothiorhodospira mobilis TaxID=195064 RepID=UPI000B8978ED|nr:phenylpyruvate tautomerase MIF-related protein [Ectothiorhodospira mobilis]
MRGACQPRLTAGYTGATGRIQFSAALTGLVGESLDVPPERVYIEFASPARHLFGFKGGTF